MFSDCILFSVGIPRKRMPANNAKVEFKIQDKSLISTLFKNIRRTGFLYRDQNKKTFHSKHLPSLGRFRMTTVCKHSSWYLQKKTTEHRNIQKIPLEHCWTVIKSTETMVSLVVHLNSAVKAKIIWFGLWRKKSSLLLYGNSALTIFLKRRIRREN